MRSRIHLLLGLALGTATAAAQTVYDPVAQFTVGSNGSTEWSYGYKNNSLTESFLPFDTAYNYYGDDPEYPIRAWRKGSLGYAPTIGANLGSQVFNVAPDIQIAQGEISLIPGYPNFGLFAVLRFTAPTTGSYDLSGSFDGNATTTSSDVHILHNNVSFFDDTVTGLGDPTFFSQTLSLASGDTVDFSVGYGTSQTVADYVGLVVTLTAVPEPATYAALTGLGALGLAMLRRRRSA